MIACDMETLKSVECTSTPEPKSNQTLEFQKAQLSKMQLLDDLQKKLQLLQLQKDVDERRRQSMPPPPPPSHPPQGTNLSDWRFIQN